MKLNANIFAAVHAFTSTEQARFYLQGVLVEPSGLLIATDGSAMFVAQDHTATGLPSEPVIISADKALLTAARNRKAGSIIFPDGYNGAATVTDDTDQAMGAGISRVIDGTFPDWRRVVPTDSGERPATLDGAILRRVSDAIKTITQRKTQPLHFGASTDSAQTIVFPHFEHAFAVICAIRKGNGPVCDPSYMARREPSA
jgi:DNA polymerase III sliding clamp (beta) subunit (PCNA family)